MLSPSPEISAPSPSSAPLPPFTRVSRNVMAGMIEREALLAQPPEFFQPFFGGRSPNLPEKLQWIERAIQRMTSLHIYENPFYHVEITYGQPFIHLTIRRRDGGSCNEWRHLQWIKNELIGPEYEAVELFPAESRLVDTSNEYHLWVHADPAYRFPLGFLERLVLEKPIQSPLAARHRPGDNVAHQRASEATDPRLRVCPS